MGCQEQISLVEGETLALKTRLVANKLIYLPAEQQTFFSVKICRQLSP